MSTVDVLEVETSLPMPGDEVPFEIVDGQRVDLPLIGVLENFIAFDLAAAIKEFIKHFNWGR